MNEKDRFIAAKKLIEKGWSRGAYAYNASGQPCMYDSSEAVSYCALGALKNAECSWYKIDEFEQLMVPQGIPIWNDSIKTTQEEVLKTFDRFIELL